MSVVGTQIYATMHRLGGAFRQYWKRITIGAFFGWLVSTFLAAYALVYLEYLGLISPDQTFPVIGVGLVWSGIALGALVAYAVRPERRSALS
jgi:hypothetical protein